jgi:hypothetical protein
VVLVVPEVARHVAAIGDLDRLAVIECAADIEVVALQ